TPRAGPATAVFLAALLASRIDRVPEGSAAVIAGEEPAAILALIQEHATRAPGQAGVLELGVRTALAVLPLLSSDGAKDRSEASGGVDVPGARSLLAGLPADAFELAQRFPDERAAWQLVYAALGFAAQPDEGQAVATAPR